MKFKNISKLVFSVIAGLSFPALATGMMQPFHNEAFNASFELVGIDGQKHLLSDYKDTVVLVNFWASWCSPCIQEIPSMQRLYQSMNEGSFEIIAINVSEQKQRVLRRLKRMDMTFTVLFDPKGEIFNQWHAKVLPTSFLLDKMGHIRYQATGPIEWDTDEVSAIIKQLLAEP